MATKTPTTTEQTDLGTLPRRMMDDRLARTGPDGKTGMSWPAYAKWMQIGESTLKKIAIGFTKTPHQTTISQIEAKLKEPK